MARARGDWGGVGDGNNESSVVGVRGVIGLVQSGFSQFYGQN